LFCLPVYIKRFGKTLLACGSRSENLSQRFAGAIENQSLYVFRSLAMFKTQSLTRPVRLKWGTVLLGIAILLSQAFILHGDNWGRVEDWHPDQMVFRNLPLEKFSLIPVSYQKPPFHSYFSLSARLPAKAIAYIFQLPPATADAVELYFARLLTAFLFLSSLVVVFKITRRSFGDFSAIVLTFILGSSAGFIAFSHFLTADIPVTFWMLLSLFFAIRILYDPSHTNYILAGFFAGIAAATKYNGLGIGIGLATAHFLSYPDIQWKRVQFWKELIFNKKFMLGLAMTPAGFLIGNPYAVFDYGRFINDFMYNLTVTPVYTGESGGNGYLVFFWRIIELVGWPAFLLLCAALLYSIFYIFASKAPGMERNVLITLWVPLLVYYIYFGSFPRLETRFVLPIVPVGLLIMGPFLKQMSKCKKVWLALLFIILGYNFVSSYYVGKRFLDDPRMEAQVWVMNNVPAGSSIESSSYVPDWNLLGGVEIQDTRMPFISGRRKVFEENFQENIWVERSIEGIEVESEELLAWYSTEELLKRKPDYVAVNSLYYNRYLDNPNYPTLGEFFTFLLQEKSCYQIRFHRETETVPFWIYPKEIDTLANTMTILEKCGQ
jgi:hypothetical protein